MPSKPFRRLNNARPNRALHAPGPSASGTSSRSPPDAIKPRLFPSRSPRRSSANAAEGGLAPAPAGPTLEGQQASISRTAPPMKMSPTSTPPSTFVTHPSQLLRNGPPLCPASLLSPSQISCLGFSLQTTSRRPKPLHWPAAQSGRQVPEFRTRARTTLAPPFMPDTHLASQQAPARPFPGQRLDPGFGCRRYAFDTSSVVRSRSPS